MNVINGGAHAPNGLDCQEFMLVPHGVKTFSESLRMGTEIFHSLKSLLDKKGLSTAVGDEGGFAPELSSSEATEFVLEAIQKTGFYSWRTNIVSFDVAAPNFIKMVSINMKEKFN